MIQLTVLHKVEDIADAKNVIEKGPERKDSYVNNDLQVTEEEKQIARNRLQECGFNVKI